MKKILNPLSAIFLFTLCGCHLPALPVVVFNPTNGVVVIPTNFVAANLAGVTVSNIFSGTASNLTGNALLQVTNAARSLIPNTATNISGEATNQVVVLVQNTLPNNAVFGGVPLTNGYVVDAKITGSLLFNSGLTDLTGPLYSDSSPVYSSPGQPLYSPFQWLRVSVTDGYTTNTGFIPIYINSIAAP